MFFIFLENDKELNIDILPYDCTDSDEIIPK